jgi:hypothetical protein
MAADPRLTDPGFCGCNAADAPTAPASIWNRPSLPAIAWRSGTFAGFRAAALRDLTVALPALTTREGDDHAITLIELWAAMADVLTFYQERIANEAYLRTAVSRDSVRRLTRLLDYKPFAGLAAETLVSFTLEKDAAVALRPGLKLMSVPGQDEVPQIFELIEEVAGTAALNRLEVRGVPFPYDPFAAGSRSAAIPTAPAKLAAGDALLAFWAGALEEKTAERVSGEGPARGLGWTPPMQAPMPAGAQLAKVERSFKLFGHNQPASRMVYDPGQKTGNAWTRQPGWGTVNETLTLPSGDATYPLDGKIDGVKPGAAFVARAAGGRVNAVVATAVAEENATFGGITDTVTTMKVAATALGRPAMRVLPDQRVDVVFRATTGVPLSSSSNAPGSGAESWTEALDVKIGSTPSGAIIGDPQVVSALTRLDVVARTEGALMHLHSAGFTTQAWTRIAAPGVVDDPAVVASAPATLRAFARGDGDVLLHATATGLGTISWGGWESLRGIVTGPVVAAAIPAGPGVPATVAGTSCAVARGADRSIWSIFVGADGTATTWRRLAELEMAPDVAIGTFGSVFVVVARTAAESALRLAIGIPGQWSPWLALPGTEGARGRPALLPTPSGYSFAWRDGDGAVKLLRLGFGGAAAPVDLGGSVAGDPVLAFGGGREIVTARWADGTLRARSNIGGTWRDWTILAPGLGAITDRRTVRFWQVSQPFIAARRHDYPATVSGSRVTVPLAVLESIPAKRRIVLSDGTTTHSATVTGSAAIPLSPGGGRALLAIDFAPPLPKPLAAATAALQGNVALAGQGETQAEEILGDGNAARPFQRFLLRKAPVTRRADPATIRGRPEITVLVDGEAWPIVDTLYGREPAERVCVLEEAEDGKTVVRFGDGVNGARLPSGRGNVRVRYRTGLGLVGNVRAGQLSILLSRPAGLRDGANPLAASGAADPESAEDLRTAAPAKVRSFGRAVSLADLAVLAVETGLAAKARADWVWSGIERAVFLTVAGPDGAVLPATTLATLSGLLDAARDTTRRLMLGAALRVPVRLSGTLFVADGFVREEVLAAVQTALRERLSFTRMGLGEPLHRSDIDLAVMAVPGVAGLDLDTLGFRFMAGFGAAGRKARDLAAGPLQPHLRFFPARPSAGTGADPILAELFGTLRPRIVPAEQAYAEARDIVLAATGGIA